MKIINHKLTSRIVFILVVLSFLLSFAMGFATTVEEAEAEFEQAWNNPDYTQIKVDDVDVNEILVKYYDTAKPINFTREMLWDMERKKAWDPKTYISHVVRNGKSWGRKDLENGDEIFVRSSEQKRWLNPGIYGDVFEEVYLNQNKQKATFLGRESLIDSSGKKIHIHNEQPLFHVQHSVAGEENHPLNVWRIVHLTNGKDEKLVELFKSYNDSKVLPRFIEIYIQKDLQTPITHK